VKYKVSIQAEAKDDFRDIHAYLKKRYGDTIAKRFKISFMDILENLATTPLMFQSVPDRKNIRKCSALSPSLIIYEVDENEKRVEIRAIYDGRSDRQIL
jgi:plasmid stabilization system protein ParE